MATAGSRTSIDVDIRFNETNAVREARRVLGVVERSVNRHSNALGGYTTDFNNFGKSIDAATSRVTAFGLTAGIFFTVKAALQQLAKATIDVEKGLTDINLILNLSSRNLKTFSEDLFRVATTTGQTFENAAKAATEFSRQGLGVQETLKRTRDALLLSRLAGIEAMTAVQDLTAAMNSFGDSILDSTQLVSKLVAVDQRFAVSSADLAEAIKRVGSTAQDAGVGIDDLIGLVTALQERTARGGAVIGNALKTIFTRIQRPEIIDQLEDFDIKVKDLNRNLLPTLDILENLVGAFNRLDQSEKIKITEKIGSLYQINQVRSLMKDLKSGDKSTASRAARIAGGAEDEALIKSDELNKTLSAQLNRTAQNLKLTFSKIGDDFLGPALRNALDIVNSNLDPLNKSGEETGGNIGKGLLRGLGSTLLPGFMALSGVLSKIAGRSIREMFTAVKSFTPWQENLRKQLEGINKSILAQVGSIDGTTGASSRRLGVERAILSTIEAQNAAQGMAATEMRPTMGGPNMGIPVVPPLVRLPLTDDINRRVSRIEDYETQYRATSDPIRANILTYYGEGQAAQLRELADQRSVIMKTPEFRAIALANENQAREARLAKIRFQIDQQRRAKNDELEMQQRAARAAAGRELRTDPQDPFEAIQFQKQAEDAGSRDNEAARIARVNELSAKGSDAYRLFGGRSARAELGRLDPNSLEAVNIERHNRMQNVAFGTTFLAPVLAGGLGEAFFGGESRGNRIGKSAVTGIGTTLSYGAMGFAMGGGVNPAGIGLGVIGTVSGLLISLTEIFKEMSSVLPEVNNRLDKLKDKIARSEENFSELNKISEMAAGIREGTISIDSTTPSGRSNLRNLKSRVEKSSQNLLAEDVSYKDIRGALKAALSGDPSKLEGYHDTIVKPEMYDQKTLGNFLNLIEPFEKEEIDRNALIAGLNSLRTRSGGSLDSILGTKFAEESLAKVKLPYTQERPGQGGGLVKVDKPGDYQGMIDVLARAARSPQEHASLMRVVEKNPKAAEEIFKSLKNRSGMANQNLVDESLKDLILPGNTPQRNFSLEYSRKLGAADLRSSQFEANSGITSALNAGGLSIEQARNQATLMGAGMNKTPYEIEALRVRLGRGELERQFADQLTDSRAKTSSGLLEGVVNLRGSLKDPNSANFDKFDKVFSLLEESAKGGKTNQFKDILRGFAASVADNDGEASTYEAAIKGLEKTLINADATETKLNSARTSTLRAYDITAKASLDMATMESQANLSLQGLINEMDQNVVTFELLRDSGKLAERAVQDYTMGLERERVRFNALKGAGFLFSDQRSAGNMSERIGDISTGKLGASGMGGAMLGSFSDQLKYGVNDMYRELIEGAATVGSALKSSFKDAFKSFLDGSRSAGDALRGLGLAFADKLLDISSQGLTNMLFGGFQNLGSAAFGRYFNSPATGATGGYVTGGSGIRDDVPAMLNEGDFVLKKSSVSKYGVGRLNALNFDSGGSVNLRNKFINGAMDVDPNLSNFALTDENNPQNRLRTEAESGELNSLLQYLQARSAYKNKKSQVRMGALLNLGMAGAAVGINYGAGAIRNMPKYRGVGRGVDAPAGYGSAYAGYAATGGLMTRFGVRTYAGGGSVDNVPALLTGGEYVINRNAVARHGVGFYNRLNRGEIPAFNTGGYVGESIPNGTSTNDNLNDSISRLITSNERLRTSMEKGSSTQETPAQTAQPTVGNISITVHMSGGETKADVQTQTAGSKGEDEVTQGRKIGEMIQAAVIGVLTKESKNGGMLEQHFQRRR